MKSGDRHFPLIHLLHERGDIARSPVLHFVRRTVEDGTNLESSSNSNFVLFNNVNTRF